jgi:hypothetical protein
MLGMSYVQVAGKDLWAPAVRTGLGTGGVIPNLVAIATIRTSYLLLNINSAATAR